MNYHWNWAVFFQISPNYGVSYLQLFLNGVAVTLGLSASSWLIAMASGSVVGILRTLKSWPVRMLALCYVQIFRGIPLLVQMFLWYFILPQLVPALKAWANDTDAGIVQFTLASICLGLYTSARIAEQVRSGLQALPPGQPAAAAALGMRRLQAYRHVLLPQTYRIIMPPLTSETMNLIKNTSIALTIGLAEITFRSREMGETTFAYFESFTIATFAYIIIALAANRASALIEHKLRHQKTAAGPHAGSTGRPLASRT
ncbi:amino acid ABC transporter permease [uncultured Castellaniella sp.]|uniref:amino acid ABC transporter permease n=1 Tax=uncultured Castellaniella sp. TaxID=647907 RepID=UPI00262785AF|nr:amino acid ABC transporter permease [uncultured Castellaniella sp.]